MKYIVFTFAIFAFNASAQKVIHERSEDLGGGFKIVYRSEELPKDPAFFEGVGHFSYFYYKNTELSQTDTFSVSPSGSYALYQDGPAGSIFLFNTKIEKSFVVVEKSEVLARNFEWSEDSKVVYVSFYDMEKSLLIRLNGCLTEKIACKLEKPIYITKAKPKNKTGCIIPEYPDSALEKHEEGKTAVSILVNINGKAINSKILSSSGSETLDSSAVKALLICDYSPALQGNTPVESWLRLSVNFKSN